MKEERQSCGGMPPRWAEAVLRSLLKPNDRDTLAGDLIEEYREAVLPARGVLHAHIWYYRQVLSFLNAGPACRTISRWLSLFCVVAGFTVNAPVYTLAPRSGISDYRATGRFSVGSPDRHGSGRKCRGVGNRRAMFFVWTVPVAILHLRHPPFGAYPVPLTCAIIIGTAGAAFGKRFTRETSSDVLSLQLSSSARRPI